MDLVLMIIALCFRGSTEKRNYTALIVLSIIGGIITLFLALGTWWVYILDCIWYVIDLILCLTADNQKIGDEQQLTDEDDN